jgi:hypothetical protein
MMEMLTHNKCCHEQFIVVAVLSGTVLLSAVGRVSVDVKDTAEHVSVRAMYGIYRYTRTYICNVCAREERIGQSI